MPAGLLARVGVAPVPPLTAAGSEFWLLDVPFPAPSPLVGIDRELERGIYPTCLNKSFPIVVVIVGRSWW